jgi:hypothetical protein
MVLISTPYSQHHLYTFTSTSYQCQGSGPTLMGCLVWLRTPSQIGCIPTCAEPHCFLPRTLLSAIIGIPVMDLNLISNNFWFCHSSTLIHSLVAEVWMLAERHCQAKRQNPQKYSRCWASRDRTKAGRSGRDHNKPMAAFIGQANPVPASGQDGYDAPRKCIHKASALGVRDRYSILAGLYSLHSVISCRFSNGFCQAPVSLPGSRSVITASGNLQDAVDRERVNLCSIFNTGRGLVPMIRPAWLDDLI